MSKDILQVFLDFRENIDLNVLERTFKERISEETLKTLLNACVILGRFNRVIRYIRIFKKHNGYIPTFAYEILAASYIKSLNLKGFQKVLPYVPNYIKVVYLVNLGFTKEAKKILEISGLKDFEREIISLNIRLLDGEKVDYEEFSKFENAPKLYALSSEMLKGFHLLSEGKIEEGMSIYEKVTSSFLEKGILPLGLQSALILYLLKGDMTGLEQIKVISESTGDRLNYLKALIYQSMIRKDLINTLKIYRKTIENVPVLRTVYHTITGEGTPTLRGLYYQTYYLKLVSSGGYWLRFSDLEVFKGNKKFKFPRMEKSKIILGLMKIGSKKAVLDNAKFIFPTSKDPRRRCYEYISRLENLGLAYCKTDLEVSLERGNFLKDKLELRELFNKYLR